MSLQKTWIKPWQSSGWIDVQWRDGNLSDLIKKKILICVLKIIEGLEGLERHESEWLTTELYFLCELTLVWKCSKYVLLRKQNLFVINYNNNNIVYIILNYMKRSDAIASKCHLKFSSRMIIFIKLVYLSSVISLKCQW